MSLLDKKLAREYDNASTQINVPDEIAAEIIRIGRELIPDEHLAGDGRVEVIHVTIKYGVQPDENVLRQAIAGRKSFPVSLGKTMAFPEASGEGTPVVIEVHGHGFEELHKIIAQAMGTMPDDFPYTPHITVAYVGQVEAQHYAGRDEFAGIEFVAEAVTLSMFDDDNQVDVPLAKAAAGYPLHLELLCGASDVDPEHDAYWDGESLTHPKQEYVEQLARERGIAVSVTGNGVNSDAYLYFKPKQLEEVVAILKEAEWRGDILDIMTPLNEKERKLAVSIAEREGWSIEDHTKKSAAAPAQIAPELPKVRPQYQQPEEDEEVQRDEPATQPQQMEEQPEEEQPKPKRQPKTQQPAQPKWKAPKKPPVETTNFKKWFGKSKVRDDDGKPMVVYHGTTHNFEAFNPDTANAENYYGKALYFTSSTEDLGSNYATESGPDLTSRIEHRSEQIMQEWEDRWDDVKDEIGLPDVEDYPSYSDVNYKRVTEKAKAEAKEEIAGQSKGLSMPVYLSIQNPVIVQKQGGTYFNIEISEDGEESGNGVEFYNAMMLVAGNFSNGNAQELWTDISENMEFTAYDFEQQARNGNYYFEDNEGNQAAGSFISQVYQEMGFDGIIQDANEAFGTGSGHKPMSMDYDTKHFIIWDPTKVKSAIGNPGKFDPKNPVITAAIDPIKSLIDQHGVTNVPSEANFILPDGRMLKGGMDHEDQAYTAKGLRRGNPAEKLGQLYYDYGFIRIVALPEFPLNIEAYKKPNAQQLMTIGSIVKQRKQNMSEDEIIVKHNKFPDVVWDLENSSGEGSLGEFRRAVDKTAAVGFKFYPITDEWIGRAKEFLAEKWTQRHTELQREGVPTDLKGACKFASLFAQKLFGGRVRGNPEHQIVQTPHRIIDLTDQFDPNTFHHDKEWFGNPEHEESMQSCMPRVNQWYEEFKQKYPPETSVTAAGATGVGDLGLAKKVMHELMPVLGMQLPEPELKIVNQPRAGWLGRDTWRVGYERGYGNWTWGDNTRIDIQRSILNDEDTLRRIIAHELCHHAVALTTSTEKIKEEKARGTGEWGYKNFVRWMQSSGHGTEWKQWASKYNAKYGADFVTEKSDESYAVEELELRPYHILLKRDYDGKLAYESSSRITPKMKRHLDRMAQDKEGTEYRLTQTNDRAFFEGYLIGSFYWGHPKDENLQKKLEELWAKAQKVLPSGAAKEQDDLLKQMREKMTGPGWEKKRSAAPQLEDLEQAVNDQRSTSLPQIDKLEHGVSKDYDRVRWVYQQFYDNQIRSMSWKDFQKKFPWAQNSPLFTQVRQNRPQITLEDMDRWMEEYNAKAKEYQNYELEHDTYKDKDTSFRDVEQLVLRINQSASAAEIIGEDEMMKGFLDQVQMGSQRSGHPVSKNTVGWLRVDFVNDQWLLIDEVQSDLINAVDLAKRFIAEPSLASLMQGYKSETVKQKIQEMGATEAMFQNSKREFARRGYTPEKLEEMKQSLANLFKDWAEYGIASVIEIARRHGVKNVAIHTGSTIAQRDPDVEADKIGMYYDQIAKAFGFKKQQLDIGELKGEFWTRTASAKTAQKRSEAVTSMTVGANVEDFPAPVLIRWEQGMRWREVLKVVKSIVGEVAGRRVAWRDIYIWASLWENQQTQNDGWADERAKSNRVMYDILHNGSFVSVGKPIASAAGEAPGQQAEYIGNCTEDEIVAQYFGDATRLAQAVENGEKRGRATVFDPSSGLLIRYNPATDIHSFYKAASHKETPLSDTTFRNPELGTETNAYADMEEKVEGDEAVPALEELAPQMFDKEGATDLKTLLMRIRGNCAKRAQQVYDAWEPGSIFNTAEGGDVEFGEGGICDMIAEEIGDLLASLGIDFTQGGQDGDDHAWVVAYNDKEAFGVDIPHQLYERGGGYSWKKVPNVTFSASDVNIFPTDIDREWLEKNAGAAGPTPEGVTYNTTVIDSRRGELFCRAEAWLNSERIGTVDFNELEVDVDVEDARYYQEKADEYGAKYWERTQELPREIFIKYVWVQPDMRRKGIATGMYEQIKKDYPGEKIISSGTTDEGGKMRRKLVERGVLAYKNALLKSAEYAEQQNQVQHSDHTAIGLTKTLKSNPFHDELQILNESLGKDEPVPNPALDAARVEGQPTAKGEDRVTQTRTGAGPVNIDWDKNMYGKFKLTVEHSWHEHGDPIDDEEDVNESNWNLLIVNAFDTTVKQKGQPGKWVGSAEFVLRHGDLESCNTEVDSHYWRQGIATAMYQFAEGFTGHGTSPHNEQSPAGRGLWQQKNRPFGKGASAETAINELNETFPVNPLNPREHVVLVDNNPVAVIEVAIREGKLRLKSIRSLQPGQGGGKAALKTLADIADRNDAEVELTASPYGDEKTRLDKDTLQDWYRRYQFEDEPGRDPALGYMVRKPKSASNIVSGEDVVSYVQKLNKWDRQTAYQVVGLDAGGDYILTPEYDLDKLEAGDDYDPELAERYAKMKTPFPPIVLSIEGKIRDGNHRVAGAKLRGDTYIAAYEPLDTYEP
jgi:2'-5' RNA ligase/GNAT superfamily N-acetyltransferase